VKIKQLQSATKTADPLLQLALNTVAQCGHWAAMPEF
jgi:hypothetical protein